MKKNNTVVLGAGLAGISLAYFLKNKDLAIFEKETEAGGLCRSQKVGRFIFDYDGHLLHARSHFFEDFIKKLLPRRLIRRRRAFVYFQNKFVPYPFQFSYQKEAGKRHNRPPAYAGLTKISNFSQWCRHKFGRKAYREFFLPYNKKFWGVSLGKLDYGWAERFIPQKKSRPLGYNWQFFYPRRGMQDFIGALLKETKASLNLGFEAVAIDIKKKRISFANGFVAYYQRLFVSVPLAELGRVVKPLPALIREDFARLKFNSIYVLNLGVKEDLSKFGHWIYFPQEDISFFRVGFPSNFSPYVVPRGYSSLYAEIAFMPNKKVDKACLEEEVISDLSRLGVIKKKNIAEKLGIFIKHAYPLPLAGKEEIVKRIEKFLAGYGVYLIGRYGRWQYYSMEDTVMSSYRAAGER